jgi:hypothetical protein
MSLSEAFARTMGAFDKMEQGQRDQQRLALQQEESALTRAILQDDLDRNRAMQAALRNIGTGQQTPGVTPEQMQSLADRGITQTSFGANAAQHQPAINARYGPQAPNGVNLHAGLDSSTAATLEPTDSDYQRAFVEKHGPQAQPQAPVEEPYKVENDRQWFFNRMADEIGGKHGINPEVVKLFKSAVLTQETKDYDAKATSPKGARGLAQLMPGTQKELGVTDPDDPIQSISGGLRYLQQMYDRFGKDPAKALAAYNAGPGNVEKHGGVPPFKETQNYVKKGVAAYNAAGEQVDVSQMTADASGRATPTPQQPPVDQWAGIQQRWQEQSQPPMQMGPPEPQQARNPMLQPSDTPMYPDLDGLRQAATIYLQHGNPEHALKLLDYVNVQAQLRVAGDLMAKSAGAKSEAERQALAQSQAAALMRAKQVDAAMKTVAPYLPMTLREKLDAVPKETSARILGQMERGEDPSVNRATEQVQKDKIAVSAAQGQVGQQAQLQGKLAEMQQNREFKSLQPIYETMGDKVSRVYDTTTGKPADPTMTQQQYGAATKDGKAILLSENNAKRIENLQPVQGILQQAMDYTIKLYGPGGVYANMTEDERQSWLFYGTITDGMQQKYPELVEARRFMETSMTTLAKGYSGEVGALTDTDIKRVQGLLPLISGGITPDIRVGLGLTPGGVGPTATVGGKMGLPDLPATAWRTLRSTVDGYNQRMRAILGNKQFEDQDLKIKLGEAKTKMGLDAPEGKSPLVTLPGGEVVRPGQRSAEPLVIPQQRQKYGPNIR